MIAWMVTVLGAMLYIAVGLLYVNALEWVIHKYLLHNLGRKRRSVFHFHFDHHRAAITNNYTDKDLCWPELVGLGLLVVGHSWMYLISPWLFLGASLAGLGYYIVHRWTHYKPELAKRYIPWHYNHHMKFPKHNWCVTLPITDIIMGTYKNDKISDTEDTQVVRDLTDNF